MNNNILHGGDVIYYAVKMNGQIISEKFTERSIAEINKAKLLTETAKFDTPNPIVEVVQVDVNGQEILFG